MRSSSSSSRSGVVVRIATAGLCVYARVQHHEEAEKRGEVNK